MLKAFVKIYQITKQVARAYNDEHKHLLIFTPVHFMQVFGIYQRLLDERDSNVKKIQHRYDEGTKQIKESLAKVSKYVKKLNDHMPGLIAE